MASLHVCCTDEAHLDGTHSRLGAVGNPQFGQDVLHMDFDRAHTYRQVAGNLPVGLPLGEQLQHFALAGREPPEGQVLLGWRLTRQALEQARTLLNDGWQANDVVKLAAAVAEADKAVKVADSGGASEDVRDEAGLVGPGRTPRPGAPRPRPGQAGPIRARRSE